MGSDIHLVSAHPIREKKITYADKFDFVKEKVSMAGVGWGGEAGHVCGKLSPLKGATERTLWHPRFLSKRYLKYFTQTH